MARPSLVRRLVPLLLLAVLALVFLAALAVGSVTIPLGQVVTALVGGDTERPVWATIVRDLRLPRAITAALAGAALGVSGLQMQTLFRNPLADPFILGISSGASLGVALVVLGSGSAVGGALVAGLDGAGDLGVAGAAAAGAGLAMALVLLVARRIQSGVTVLIVGLMVGYAATAIVSVLVWTASLDRVQAYLAWSLGSFRGVTWDELRVLAPAVLIGLAAAHLTVKPLNALLLGEGYAASMGVNVRRVRWVTVASASVLAGTVTAFCGPIAFVGVAVPHLARGLVRSSDHRVLMPAVALLGATVALVAEIVAQTPGADSTMPVNAVTALLGAPVVVIVLLRSRHATRAMAT